MIEELFKRYMDDGFLPWYSTLDLNVLKNVLNNLNPTIKFTVEPAKFDNFSKTLVINFLDITVLLHENGYVETDILYKETNTHNYLNYDNHQPNHIKYNISFNFGKTYFTICVRRAESSTPIERATKMAVKLWFS